MSGFRQPARFRLLLSLLLLGWCGAGCANSEERLAEAAALARAGDFAPAWCIWDRLAEQGNVEALYNLGWLYRNGQGVASDDEQARRLWEEAGSKGHAEAQMALGMLYADSRTVGPDQAQAVRWFRLAAGQGIEDAVLILLDYMDKGDTAAFEALHELARQGEAGTAVSVSVDEANVRAQPSTRARVLATLPAGERVLRYEVRNDWWRVWVGRLGEFGWMYRSLFD